MIRSRFLCLAVSVWLAVSPALPAAAAEGSIRFIRDAEVEHIIRTFATPIFEAAGLDPSAISVYLIEDNRLNAFVAGGMNLFLNTGTLIRSEGPLQIMGVIAHETGHIAGGHLARAQEAMRSATIQSIIETVLGAVGAAMAKGGSGGAGGASSVAQRSFFQYTRAQEAAADQAGISYLERAGYSARGLLEFFEILSGEEALFEGNQDPYLHTHPLTQDRIEAVRYFVSKARHSDTPPPPEFVELHARMRAKLIGFLQPLGQVLKQYPESNQNLDARYARAIAYYRASDLNKALPILDQLIVEHPADPYFHELKGQIMFENGRLAEAVQGYQKAVDLDPGEPLLRLGLAQAQLETEQANLVPPALAQLEDVVRHEPKNGFAWHLLAVAYGRTDQLGMAALALSEAALARSDRQEARVQAERAMRTLPENSPAWLRAQDIQRAASKQQNS